MCRAIGGEQAVQPSPPPKDLPADQTTSLGNIVALQDQKKLLAEQKGPSWQDHKEDRNREKEERKLNRGNSGWFGFGGKEKEE